MKAAQAAAERDRELARISQARAEEEARGNQADAAKNFAAGKKVRGSRLLASTQSGGLANTLGGA
jgi:hypothetical protein